MFEDNDCGRKRKPWICCCLIIGIIAVALAVSIALLIGGLVNLTALTGIFVTLIIVFAVMFIVEVIKKLCDRKC